MGGQLWELQGIKIKMEDKNMIARTVCHGALVDTDKVPMAKTITGEQFLVCDENCRKLVEMAPAEKIKEAIITFEPRIDNPILASQAWKEANTLQTSNIETLQSIPQTSQQMNMGPQLAEKTGASGSPINFSTGIGIETPVPQKINEVVASRPPGPVNVPLSSKDLANNLKTANIDTLRSILQTSQQLDKDLSRLAEITGITVIAINSLKGKSVSVPLMGKKSAWDAVKVVFVGIDTCANQLEIFNKELSEWKSGASSVTTHLPNVISCVTQSKSGGDINPQNQIEVFQCLSAFGVLENKTSNMSERLNLMSMLLSKAESGLQIAAKTPLVGSHIRLLQHINHPIVFVGI